jgi:hypothetical protein
MDNQGYFNNESIRLKIDKLLQQNAALESSLGLDSTKKEHTKVKVKQAKLFDKIRELDLEFYNIIVLEDDRS